MNNKSSVEKLKDEYARKARSFENVLSRKQYIIFLELERISEQLKILESKQTQKK